VVVMADEWFYLFLALFVFAILLEVFDG